MSQAKDLVNNVPVLSVDGIHLLFEAKQRIKALNTQSQVQFQMPTRSSSPFDYYVLGCVMSHSSFKWETKFELGPNENVFLTMFAKGASACSSSPASVEHPIQLQIIKFPETDSITCLHHLASSGPHFLKRVKGLTLQGKVFHGDSYELFSSPHLRLHSLELVQTLNSGILCEQNTLRNLTISWKLRVGPFAAEECKALCKWLSSP